MPSSIAIIDYGMANLRSVQKAFEQILHPADILSTPDHIADYDRIVLPGVGAFKDAVATLRDKGFIDPIKSHIAKGRPFLGICLGLQMLFDVGFEDGQHPGLGILPGSCIRFDVDSTLNLKVPHMGWNQLTFTNPSPLFTNLPDGSNVYFVHGYHVTPADPSIIATTTDYGRPFVSSIRHHNILATQFHPEKSQKVGLQILQNFATFSE
jgi:imidazole glycerol-phosphate synthase subunit HisH